MLMTPLEIYELVAPELGLVEEELRQYTRSDIPPISEIGEYVLTAGGKRLQSGRIRRFRKSEECPSACTASALLRRVQAPAPQAHKFPVVSSAYREWILR